MLFLVRPIFISRFLTQIYATINLVESYEMGTIGTVLDQTKLNDEIIKIFKQKFPNPTIVFKRLKETEFYTISLDKQSDIDFAELEKKHDIDSVLHLRFHESDTAQDSSFQINRILFELSTTEQNYTPFTDKEFYLDRRAKIQELIQYGKILSGNNLNNINLNERNYTGAHFAGSEMNDGEFINAKLIGADFTDVELNNAHFNKADLRFAYFSVATITGKASFVGANLKFADLTGAVLTGADLSDADLRHANLSGATLTDCIINENTKIYGAILEDATYDENFFNEENINQYEDDDEYEEYIRQYEEYDEDGEDGEEEEIDHSVEDALAEKAEQLPAKEVGNELEDIKLPALEIIKTAKINNTPGQTYTFEKIVSLLEAKITNVKIPLSQMALNKWYGISSIGNTSPAIWEQVGVNKPRIGTVFKSISVPIQESDEAIVYETVATCMGVHELARSLDIDNLFQTFLESVEPVFTRKFDEITRRVHDQEQLELFAMMLYNLLIFLLSKHNDYETVDSWTHIYDDIEKRKKLVKHLVFNREEGIMYHPRFDYTLQNGYSEDILVLIMFIESLPIQVQVVWAQYYVQDFIEGYRKEETVEQERIANGLKPYGQLMTTFNPYIHMASGFIASCLNGNLEKMLLSIRTAIVQFYPRELEEESEEEKLQILKNAVTGSVFDFYYKSVDDVAGPTLEGYKNYIQTNIKEELRQKYLELLEDQEVIDKITETIRVSSGGKKNKHMKRKTIKRRKTINRRKTMKRKTMKRRKTIKRKTDKKNSKIKTHKK